MYGGAGESTGEPTGEPTPPSPTTIEVTPPTMPAGSVGNLTDMNTDMNATNTSATEKEKPQTLIGTVTDSFNNFTKGVADTLAPEKTSEPAEQTEQSSNPENDSQQQSETEQPEQSEPSEQPEQPEQPAPAPQSILENLAKSNADLAESVKVLTNDLQEANNTIAELKQQFNPTPPVESFPENSGLGESKTEGSGEGEPFGLDDSATNSQSNETENTVSNGSSEMPFSPEEGTASSEGNEQSSEMPMNTEQGTTSAEGNGQSSEMPMNSEPMPMNSEPTQGQEQKTTMGGKSRQQRKRKNRRTRKFKYIYRY